MKRAISYNSLGLRGKSFGNFDRILRDQGGAIAVITALALPVLLGFAALGVDVAGWYAQARAIQTAADAAAISAALESMRTSDPAQIQAAALRDAARNGVGAASGDDISVNIPPQSGPFAGDPSAAEIVVNRPGSLFFGRILASDGPVLTARSVARASFSASGHYCVWAMNPEMRAAVKVSGGAVVNLDCGIVVNSADLSALSQDGGGSCLTASGIRLVGDFTGDCVHPQPTRQAAHVADPLAGMPAPVYGACDTHQKIKVMGGETRTIQPGVYCSGIEVLGSGRLTFAPGLYVLDGAGLKFSAQSEVFGEGVFFYLTENSGTSDGIAIAGDANVDLSAPVDGDYAGVLFFQDRNAPANVTHTLAGGSSMRMSGILYFPKQAVTYAGGSEADLSASLIVVDSLTFTGNSHVGNLAASAVAENRYLVRAALLE